MIKWRSVHTGRRRGEAALINSELAHALRCGAGYAAAVVVVTYFAVVAVVAVAVAVERTLMKWIDDTRGWGRAEEAEIQGSLCFPQFKPIVCNYVCGRISFTLCTSPSLVLLYPVREREREADRRKD